MQTPITKNYSSAMRITCSRILICWAVTCVVFGQARLQPLYNHAKDSLLQFADSLLLFEEYDAALAEYQQLVEMMQDHEDWPGCITVMCRIAQSQIAMDACGEAKTAIEHAQQQLDDRLAESKLHSAIIDHVRGLYHDACDQNSLAYEAYARSLRNLDSCCPDAWQIIGDVATDYAWLMLSRDPQSAQMLAQRALDNYEKLLAPSPFKIIRTHYVLARAYNEIADTEAARTHSLTARKLLEAQPEAPHVLKLQVYSRVGAMFIQFQEYHEAIEIYRKLISLEEAQSEPRPAFIARYYSNIVSAYVYLNDARVVSACNTALSILGPNVRTYLEIRTRGFCQKRLADYYIEQGKYDSAYTNLISSIATYRVGPDLEDFASYSWQSLAELHLLRKEPGKALTASDSALAMAGFRPELVDSLDGRNIDEFYDPLELKGRVLYHMYHASGDPAYLDTALDSVYHVIERIAQDTRSGPYSDATKRLVSEHFSRAAKGALRVLHAMYLLNPEPGYVAQAFGFMEHNRYARILLNITSSESAMEHGIPAPIIEKERELTERIAALEQEDSPSRADSLAAVRTRYQEFRKMVSERYPGYYEIQYDSLFSVGDIQSRLAPGTVLLEYFWGDSTLSVVSITSETAVFGAIDLAGFRDDLDALQRWMVGSSAVGDIDYATYTTLANRLYRQLVFPYLTASTERLILSPDGPLAYLPFETLITENTGQDFKSARYLLRDLEVQYAYSGNVLFKRIANAPNRQPRVLAMSYTDVDDLQNLIDLQLQLDHSPLPFSDEEIEGIAKIFGRKRVTRLKGPNASESAFKKHVSGHDIVHLAIHGLGDTTAGINSHLVFRTDRDTLDDGQLYAYDVYGLPMDHLRMAVLSACETGVGKDFPGEGIFSIARGFAYARTPTTVMSLWSVQDRATSQIMKAFYQNLASGMRVSAALREAKLSYLDQASHRRALPVYWAPMVAYGDVSPVATARNNRLLWWVGGLLLLALIIWGFRRIVLEATSNTR